MAEIFFRPRANRGFKIAHRKEKVKIKLALGVLRSGKFPMNTKKLEGTVSGYRIRIGKWRILFVLSGDVIDVVDIFRRKEDSDYRS